MGMPNSLGNFAWDAEFPVQYIGDTKNTEGVPKSLGGLTRCLIPYDTGHDLSNRTGSNG